MVEYNFDVKVANKKDTIIDVRKFVFEEGKITFLFGESGIGKTLASKSIFGLMDDPSLNITINKKDYSLYKKHKICKEFGKHGFFVFQEPSSHFNPLAKIGEQLNEGDIFAPRLDGKILNRLWDGIDEGFRDELLDVYPRPYRPSGGEKQRLLAALAFKKIYHLEKAAGHNLFIFDEPTGNLDNFFRDIFLDFLIEEFFRRNMTVLFITHDYSIISYLQDNYHFSDERFAFKELVKQKNYAVFNEFKPKEYTSWIKGNTKTRRTTNNRKNLLLTLQSGVEVFGKELIFSKDKHTNYRAALKVFRGEITYLKAPSGLGKTTILKIIMGLQKAEQFALKINEEEMSESTPVKYWKNKIWGKVMSIVFQHADEALNLNNNVINIFKGLPGVTIDKEKLQTDLSELLKTNVDDSFLNKKVKHLSGGQKQKINLYRSLLLDTDILLLDEPTSGMDFESIKTVIKLLSEKIKEGKGILLVSHNEDIFDSIIHEDNTYYLKDASEK